MQPQPPWQLPFEADVAQRAEDKLCCCTACRFNDELPHHKSWAHTAAQAVLVHLAALQHECIHEIFAQFCCPTATGAHRFPFASYQCELECLPLILAQHAGGFFPSWSWAKGMRHRLTRQINAIDACSGPLIQRSVP